jgi:hypothetical protein
MTPDLKGKPMRTNASITSYGRAFVPMRME